MELEIDYADLPPGPQGEPGLPGKDGRDGKDGKDGQPGRDGKDGLPGKDGKDGRDGENGIDGLIGPRGEPGLSGRDGQDGVDGIDGSPGTGYTWRGQWNSRDTYQPGDTVRFSGSAFVCLVINSGNRPGVHHVQGFDSKNGDLYWDIMAVQGDGGPQGPNGANGAAGATGATGATGPAGPGVAVGGTTGQVLSKIDNTDYNTQWVTPSSALTVKDEGTSLDGNVTSIDFVGSGVTATNTGHAITVTIPGATGNITGPGSSTDRAIPTWNGTTGTILRDNSGVTISATGNLTANNFSGSHSGTSSGTNTGDQTITLSGDATGSGTGALAVTLASVVTAGTNTKITYNAKGLVTAGAAATLASADFANQGTATTVLHGNASGNPSFSAVSLTADITGTLSVANGGTGATTLTSHGVVLGNSTGAVGVTAAGTNGQLLIGQTSANPTWNTASGDATVNSSGNISVTQMAGQPYASIFNIFSDLPNSACKRVFASGLAIGHNDIYTCPSNKRAWVQGLRCSAVAAGGTVVFFPEIKISATYFRLAGSSSVSSGTFANTLANGFIMEANDVLSINTATTANGVVMGEVIEFDNTAKIRTVRTTGPSSGNNTFYTVPANNSSIVFNSLGNSQWLTGVGLISFVADSGGTRNCIAYNVPNGGSAGSTNQMSASTAIGANSNGNLATGGTMTAGDFLVLNVDTGNSAQLAFAHVYESPNT